MIATATTQQLCRLANDRPHRCRTLLATRRNTQAHPTCSTPMSVNTTLLLMHLPLTLVNTDRLSIKLLIFHSRSLFLFFSLNDAQSIVFFFFFKSINYVSIRFINFNFPSSCSLSHMELGFIWFHKLVYNKLGLSPPKWWRSIL